MSYLAAAPVESRVTFTHRTLSHLLRRPFIFEFTVIKKISKNYIDIKNVFNKICGTELFLVTINLE